MSTDLRTRLADAVDPVVPRPLDTQALWRRGRRQRRARQAAPVLAVLAVVGLGLGALVAVADAPRDRVPLAPIEDGRGAGVPGWTRVTDGAVVGADDVVAAAPDDIEVATALLGDPDSPFGGFDVRADGAIVTVLHHVDRGGIVVRYPGDDGWTRIGMPVAFLEDEAGYAVHTVQWGPDGRIYLTGMAPDATNRSVGLTQVAVIETDGTVVGVRENDAGQQRGFVFVDGFAWQQQQSEPDRQRWQPVVAVGGAVLQMPDQRAGEWEDVVAPDGMAVTDTFDGTFEARAGDRTVSWRALGGQGIGLWDHVPAGRRVAAVVPGRPSGPLAWLTDATEADGVLVQTVAADGSIAAVHLPAEAVGEPWSLVNGAGAVVGGDGRLYWIEHSPDGPAIVRYRHPLP